MTGNDACVELHRRFGAAPERVFAAFSDPVKVAQWLRPSPEIGLTVLGFDFRVGGAYRFAYHLPDAQVVRIGGLYRVIERPREIRFSWTIEPPDPHAGIESEVTVQIVDDSGGSTLTIRHERLDLPGALERHTEGWRGALTNLDAVLGETERGA